MNRMRKSFPLLMIFLLTLLLTASALPVLAQPEDRESETAGEMSSATEMDVEELQDVETQPVPVPEPSAKAMRYYHSGNVLWVVSIVVGIGVPLLVLFLGWSGKIGDFAKRVTKRWWFGFALYFAIITAIISLISLPLDFYSGFIRQHAYGLSTQSFGSWVGDWLKNLMVSVIFGWLIFWIPFSLIRRRPKRWWLYFGMGSVPVAVLIMLITPIWVDPLFDHFGPMQNKDLEAKILTLADRAGIEGSRVFEVDKSAKTNTVNAYVTGFGATKRIVLWDTIIKKLNDRELLFVMGHEMGHYVLGHVWKMILLLGVLITFAMWIVHISAGWFLKRWGTNRFKVTELGDYASYPLMFALVMAVFLVIAPLINAYSRAQEHACDTFGLELTHDNYAAASAFAKLQEENLANPNPGWFYVTWRMSHPPLAQRIEFCNSYKPWETGQPLKYDKYFKDSGVAKTDDKGEDGK